MTAAAGDTEAIVARLKARGISRSGFRSAAMAKQIAGDSPDSKEFQVQPNTVDPRKAIVELDQAIPKDWDIVVGAGHYFSMVMTHMKGRPAERRKIIFIVSDGQVSRKGNVHSLERNTELLLQNDIQVFGCYRELFFT